MKPNIVQIVTDQQHPDLVGALGKLPVITPHLDRLCQEGTAFIRAYTPCPLCTPARASLVTGQYPTTHGAWSIGTTLDDACTSLPQILSAAGYRTGIIGKSHLRPAHDPTSLEGRPKNQDWGFFERWRGPWYGFEEATINTGHTNEPHAYSMHYGLWLRQHGIPAEPPFFATEAETDNYGKFGTWELPDAYHSGAWIAEETANFIKKQQAAENPSPFYLSINLPDPHLPFRVSEKWRRMYDDVTLPEPKRQFGEAKDKPRLYQATLDGSIDQKWSNGFFVPNQYAGQQSSCQWTAEEEEKWRIYLGMTSLLDSHVGQILGTLDQYALTDNTIVVFTTDHGDYMGHHWLWSKGGSHYDAAVRVPFIVRWPEKVPAGQKSTSLQSLVDLPATFLSVAGLPPCKEMEGVDQSKSWQEPQTAIRDSVLIDHRVETGIHVRSLITEDSRLSIHEYSNGDPTEHELYDFATDPDELTNIAAQSPEKVSVLAKAVAEIAPTRTAPWPERTSGA